MRLQVMSVELLPAGVWARQPLTTSVIRHCVLKCVCGGPDSHTNTETGCSCIVGNSGAKSRYRCDFSNWSVVTVTMTGSHIYWPHPFINVSNGHSRSVSFLPFRLASLHQRRGCCHSETNVKVCGFFVFVGLQVCDIINVGRCSS